MDFIVDDVQAAEILDSRGWPTLAVTIALEGGAQGAAAVPAGCSVDSREALVLRDADPDRYAGRGVLRAVAAVTGEIAELLRSRSWSAQEDVDGALIDLDGTPDKARLGGNAISGVSMVLSRALARRNGIPLYEQLALPGTTPRLPVPHFNVIDGGAHVPNGVAFQEFMIAPLGAPSMADAVRAGAEIHVVLRGRLAGAGLPCGLGDEGGFAPDTGTPERLLVMIEDAIVDAGYAPGASGVAIALDPAAGRLRGADGVYCVAGDRLSSAELVERYAMLAERWPVWSIEDGMAEDDAGGWRLLTRTLGTHVQLVGDEIFVPDPGSIAAAAGRRRTQAPGRVDRPRPGRHVPQRSARPLRTVPAASDHLVPKWQLHLGERRPGDTGAVLRPHRRRRADHPHQRGSRTHHTRNSPVMAAAPMLERQVRHLEPGSTARRATGTPLTPVPMRAIPRVRALVEDRSGVGAPHAQPRTDGMRRRWAPRPLRCTPPGEPWRGVLVHAGPV